MQNLLEISVAPTLISQTPEYLRFEYLNYFNPANSDTPQTLKPSKPQVAGHHGGICAPRVCYCRATAAQRGFGGDSDSCQPTLNPEP